MTEEAKEARRAYIKEWRKKNPEKTKKYNEKHWERVAQRQREETANE